MGLRGVRGATTVAVDTFEMVIEATQELLNSIIAANPGLLPDDVASVIFTVTNDLNSVHPARAARDMGWRYVPMMCAQEIPVPGSLPKCIRILIHWNTNMAQKDIKHVYLREAASLRPDLVNF